MKFSLPPHWEHFDTDHELAEENVTARAGSYKGLAPEALYTSVPDLLSIFADPLTAGTLVDLGCGNGKSVLLYASLFPDRSAIGLEFEEARLKVGESFKEKFQLRNAQLLKADLMSCHIPEADTYLLYFPTGAVLDRILNKLYSSKHAFRLIVIESHGDLIPRIELENWLKFEKEISLTSARHHAAARIYTRLNVLRDIHLAPFDLSFAEKFILIGTDEEEWIGETLGMEWSLADRFELQVPPRTILWRDVKKLMVLNDLSRDVRKAVLLRRAGELTIHTATHAYHGFIRKIFTSGVFSLELSSGEKVEWEKITRITQDTRTCYEYSPSF